MYAPSKSSAADLGEGGDLGASSEADPEEGLGAWSLGGGGGESFFGGGG